jgi:hypothetical protein
VSGHLWWYVARSGGVVAWILLAASVLWGLALSTKALGKRPHPSWLLDLHRFLGGLALVFTGIHVGALVLDSYVSFGLLQVLVPFTGSYRPEAVAWGVVGLYLLLAVEVTSLLRPRIPKHVWRRVHLASFGLFAVSTLHGLQAGTDGGNQLLRWAMVGATTAVVALTALRIAQALAPAPARPMRPARAAAGRPPVPRPRPPSPLSPPPLSPADPYRTIDESELLHGSH